MSTVVTGPEGQDQAGGEASRPDRTVRDDDHRGVRTIAGRYEFGAEDVELSAFHPLGTARMAQSPDEGACDANGQVFGRESLYIADGAAVPTSLGVNPQVTIMALALRLGARLSSEKRAA